MENDFDLQTLLAELAAREGGSDLHLVAGQPPVFRVNGELVRRDGPAFDGPELETLLAPYLGDAQKADLHAGVQDAKRTLRHNGTTFRCHVFRERGQFGAAVRRLPSNVPTVEDLELPPVIEKLTHTKRGLILITGSVGSGKSTTCAAMIETVNRTRAERILTIEDPMEYVFQSRQSLITQRVVGEDVVSFEEGVRAAWQEDPDIILIGQLRNMEMVQLALALAETGHLVLSTVHGESAPEAVQRIVEVFPEPRETIRRLLARTLQAIIAQKLLVRADRPGRAPANEILLGTPRVRQMIAEGKEADLGLAIEAGRGQGMQTMDDSVVSLFQTGAISHDTARTALQDPSRLPAPPA